MSLNSTRGRWTSDNLTSEILLSRSGKASTISSFAYNPENIIKNVKLKNNTSTTKKENTNIQKKLNSHEYYNEKLNSYINGDNFNRSDNKYKNFTDKYSDEYAEKKKFVSIKLIVAMIVVEIFTLFGVFSLGTFIRISNMTQNVTFSKANVENTNIAESTLAVMKGYKTVAIFGVDSRSGSLSKGANADVNLIANLNLETGDVQLVSIYRDLYLSVTDGNSYNKLNSAYANGGPESAVKALNKNLDLNIQNFFSFNWKAVADGVELLGGVDLEISSKEFKYMNAFIHETCVATGIDAKNPAAHYIKSKGMQHLDGVQAVAYGRLRLMDSDFQRVERQKKVIALCLEKAKKLDMSQLRLIMEAILPQVAYEFDMDEMISILRIITKINIVASCGCPETSNVVTMNMGAHGDCVVPISLEKAVKKLHQILFGDDDYTVSSAVRAYSNRIIELRNQYALENQQKAESESLAAIESSIAEEESKKSGSSTVPRKRSTTSNTTKNNTASQVVIGDNVIIIEDEEPEGDYVKESESTTTGDRNSGNAPININGPIDSIPLPSENTSQNNSTNNNSTNNSTNNSNNNASGPSSANVVVGPGPGSDTTNNNSNSSNNSSNTSINGPTTNTQNSGPSGQSSGVVVGPPTGTTVESTTANNTEAIINVSPGTLVVPQ